MFLIKKTLKLFEKVIKKEVNLWNFVSKSIRDFNFSHNTVISL